jgi:hypothetical protein
LCGRVDNGANPHFVEFQVAGSVLQLDGTVGTISATKRIDFRGDPGTDLSTWGSDSQEIARQAANAKDDNGNPRPRDPWPQILQARQHILSLAESKAKNRAIRSLGIRTAFTLDEIRKGFAVAKLQFTGRHEDPELERMAAEKILDRAMGSTNMLYGSPAGRLLPGRTVPRIQEASVVPDEDDHDGHDTTAAPAPAKSEPEKPAATPAPTPAPAAQPKPAPAGKPAPQEGCTVVPPKSNPMLICGKKGADGKWPRKPCSEFSPDDLRAKIASAEKGKPTWEARWASKNQEELDAMKAWLVFKEFDPNQPDLGYSGPGPDDSRDTDRIPF